MRILLTLILFFSFVGWGQGLSINEAIGKALKNNYQILLVKTNYEVARTQNTWGMAGMSPTFDLNVVNNANLTDNSNNPASFFPGLFLSESFSPSIDMNWTLFSGFGIRINKQRLEELQAQTRGNAAVVIESTVYEVILAYYTAVTQLRKLALVNEMLDFSIAKREYFRMKADLGVGTTIDMLEFENLVLNDSMNLLTQELAYRNALRNLNLLMGEGIENEYQLTDSVEFDVPTVTYDQLKNSMQNNNQNIKNQYINIALQELNLDAQKAAYYPVVSLNLGAKPSVGYIELFGDAGFNTTTNSASYYGTISARYTLFNGFQRKRNKQVAELQAEMATMELEELNLSMSHDLRGIFERYQLQASVEDMALNSVYNAIKLWNHGVSQYENGKINIFNLNDIRLSYLQARLNYYDRLYDLLKTHYDLYRITGQIAQEYKVDEEVDK